MALTIFKVSGGRTTVTAGEFSVGVTYCILTLGTTDFTLIGASENTVGITFLATGKGEGTGTANAMFVITIKGFIQSEAQGTEPYLSACRRLAVSGDNAYVTTAGDDSLTLVDVSVPTQPISQRYIKGTGAPNYLSSATDVVVDGDYAYVVSMTDNALVIIDITTPTVNAGSFVIGTVYRILALGTTDFTLIGATSNTIGLRFVATGAGSGSGTAIDILPTLVDAVVNSSYLLSVRTLLKIDNGAFSYVYANSWSNSYLSVFYVTNPAEPTFPIIDATDIVTTPVYRILTLGTTDFTLIGAASNEVGVVFKSTGHGNGTGTATPISLTRLSHNYVRGILGMARSGNYIYCACQYYSQFTVLDISTPIVTAGSFAVGSYYTIFTLGTTDFTLIGADSNNVGVMFIATGFGVGTGTAFGPPIPHGLLTHAQVLGGSAVAISGDYAFLVSATKHCMTVIDISDPANPAYVTHFGASGSPTYMNSPQDIVISGAYAYIVTSGYDALIIVDISDPTAPTLAGLIRGESNGLNSCLGVDVSGDYVYVTSSQYIYGVSTKPLARFGGIVRSFWAGIGGRSVYEATVYLGGMSTSYLSPIDSREIPTMMPSVPLPSGYNRKDYATWLVDTGIEMILKLFGHFPTYEEWVAKMGKILGKKT